MITQASRCGGRSPCPVVWPALNCDLPLARGLAVRGPLPLRDTGPGVYCARGE
jgi:hypothetical protein